MNRRPTSIRLNGCLLAASLILLALDLATGHVRGAIYATVAVIAFGSLLAVGIRENRAENRRTGETRAYRHHDHNHDA